MADDYEDYEEHLLDEDAQNYDDYDYNGESYDVDNSQIQEEEDDTLFAEYEEDSPQKSQYQSKNPSYLKEEYAERELGEEDEEHDYRDEEYDSNNAPPLPTDEYYEEQENYYGDYQDEDENHHEGEDLEAEEYEQDQVQEQEEINGRFDHQNNRRNSYSPSTSYPSQSISHTRRASTTSIPSSYENDEDKSKSNHDYFLRNRPDSIQTSTPSVSYSSPRISFQDLSTSRNVNKNNSSSNEMNLIKRLNNKENLTSTIQSTTSQSSIKKFTKPYPTIYPIEGTTETSAPLSSSSSPPPQVSQRVTKVAKSESQIKQEIFKECTFKPVIKPLPPSYGPLKEDGTPFVTRVMKWNKEKQLNIMKKNEIINKMNDDLCTFQPKINKNSLNSVKFNRGMNQSDKKDVEKITERLYNNHIIMYNLKNELYNKEREKAREEEEEQCTFQPILTYNKNYQDVKPKYLDVFNKEKRSDEDARRSYEEKLLADEINKERMKECTFAPKINEIKPNMNLAKVYVSSNVVDRLSRPSNVRKKIDANVGVGDGTNLESLYQESDDNKSIVIDAATFIGSLGVFDQKKEEKENRNNVNKRSSSATRSTSSSVNFNQFLERQKLLFEKKQEKLNEIQRSTTPTFRPKITSKSDEILEQFQSKSFLERVEYNEKKKERELKKKIELQKVEYDFQPKLYTNNSSSTSASSSSKRMNASEFISSSTNAPSSSTSTSRPSSRQRSNSTGRSSYDLSYGDSMKREINNRLIKLKVEEEVNSELTFHPKLSTYAKNNAKSTLKNMIESEDSSKYQKWLLAKEEKLEKMREEEREKKELKESESCTFIPKTTQCPKYIERIADTISIIKQVRSSSIGRQREAKPEWK